MMTSKCLWQRIGYAVIPLAMACVGLTYIVEMIVVDRSASIPITFVGGMLLGYCASKLVLAKPYQREA